MASVAARLAICKGVVSRERQPKQAYGLLRRLYAEARREGILIDQGYLRFLSETPPMNYFSLSFSSIGIERIEPGIRKLSRLVDSVASR